MSATREPPLDEVQWRSPQIAQSMSGVHSNSVLHYFAHSPFFDATSNNATLATQATYNAAMYHINQTREAFEGRLRTMQGLEFMVAHEPTSLPSSSQLARQGAPNPRDQRSSIWVIHKQYRRKTPGASDQVTVLGVYFVVGENIYMAPSVANVVGSRLLSTVASLTKYLSTVSPLPIFSPALGNVYIRPMSKPPTAATSQTRSRSSKESTPALEGSQQGGVTSVSSSAASRMDSTQESRMLADSFAMTLRHELEYMDDNPLVGEPGSFILSSSSRGATQASAAATQPKAVNAAKTAVGVGRETAASPAASNNDAPIAATAVTAAAGSPLAGKGWSVDAGGDTTAGSGKEDDRTSPTNTIGTGAFMAGSKAKRRKSRASSAAMPSGLMSG